MRWIKHIAEACMLLVLLLCTILWVPRIAGYTVYSVASGSMEPFIKVGDAVFVQPCSFRDIKEGDIITYSLNQGKTLVTHRILKIDREKGAVQTKGDANECADANWISQEAILGKVVYHIRKLGFLFYILSQTTGKLYVIALLLWLTALQMVLEAYSGKKKKKGDA